LQITINILTDQEDNENVDTEEVPELSQQKKPIRHSFLRGFSKPDKGKGKNTRNQSSQKKILPASKGGDDDSSSSNEEPNQRKPWHPKSHRKFKMPEAETVHEQAKN